MISPTLADAIFWVAVAACLVAQTAILRSVLRAAAASPATTAARRGAEILWAVAPAVALAFVLAATWRTLHARSADAGAPSVTSAAVAVTP